MTIRKTALGPKLLIAGATFLAISACEIQPPPSNTDIMTQALPPGTVVPAAWSTTGAPTSAVGGNWVASFRDPNMTSLVNEALRNNRDLAAAAARVEAALQTVVIAGAPILPQVGFEAGAQASRNYTRNRNSQERGALLVASWELDVWGRLRSDRAASVAVARSVADDAIYAQQSIAATVARSWIANIQLRRLKSVSIKSADIYAHLLRLTEEQVAEGLVSDFDVAQASSRLNAARAATSEIETTQNEAIGGLELLLGRYPALKLRATQSYPRMPGALPASGLPLSLLDRRPDVAAARNRVIAAFYKVDVAKLTRLPGISISAAGGSLLDPDFLLTGANPQFLRIGVSLLQPIFAGGALEADIARMNAKQAEAVANYGQTVLKAFKEVETALANERVLRRQLANWRQSLTDATSALEFANDNYIAGTIDMLGLLQLQEFQIGRQVDVIETEADLLSNRVSLYLALGEPF
ncbi:efflux transporter outer membrane subunit [Roseovarius sp. M141]|uniref:efflux transporter outer membrane subunit n=1 Tax=Roseovarius sp. M141 TaxID=2583806 RepID=UPI0020CCA6A0|nr:efflux transporter outer membrane subunit [Roseovarius sp. M141]MCQ0093413.1 efflux transporter outer membrane subunit [Roseovarius sp. M141]